MRLAVYTDYVYRQAGDGVFAERAFALFLGHLAGHVDRMVIVGRLDPRPGRSHYRLPDDVEFVPLPHYRSLDRPREALPAMAGSLRRFWRVLDDADAVWLLGPYLLSVAFAGLALLRRRPVILGVRQDLPRYLASRHPGRRWIRAAGLMLEGTYRLLARRCPVIVVGPDLARRYRHARALLPISVSLVDEADIVPADEALGRSYEGELTALSVGRLEAEKNPLLLADALALLRSRDPRWRLVVAGEGPLEDELRDRLMELGLERHAELRGYVPFDQLAELYRASHAFLHVSWTEGVPQVLFEAFAAGLPVVATAVGGVPDAAGEDALLVPAGDAEAAAKAVARLGEDVALRRRLVEGGTDRVRRNTTDAECRRVAAFLALHVNRSSR